jgi:hypothetical protein
MSARPTPTKADERGGAARQESRTTGVQHDEHQRDPTSAYDTAAATPRGRHHPRRLRRHRTARCAPARRYRCDVLGEPRPAHVGPTTCAARSPIRRVAVGSRCAVRRHGGSRQRRFPRSPERHGFPQRRPARSVMSGRGGPLRRAPHPAFGATRRFGRRAASGLSPSPTVGSSLGPTARGCERGAGPGTHVAARRSRASD